jgi:hypothetical protein
MTGISIAIPEQHFYLIQTQEAWLSTRSTIDGLKGSHCAAEVRFVAATFTACSTTDRSWRIPQPSFKQRRQLTAYLL